MASGQSCFLGKLGQGFTLYLSHPPRGLLHCSIRMLPAHSATLEKMLVAECGRRSESPSGSPTTVRSRDECLYLPRPYAVPSAHQAVSFLSALFLTTLLPRPLPLTRFAWLTLSYPSSWKPFLAPDWALSTSFLHRPDPILTIIIISIMWYTALAPQVACSFLRALSCFACNRHPSQPLSPTGKLFQDLASKMSLSLTF